MSRKKTIKKPLVSAQLDTREYDLQNPNLTHGPVHKVRMQKLQRELSRKAEAQADEDEKNGAEAIKHDYEDAEKRDSIQTNKQNNELENTNSASTKEKSSEPVRFDKYKIDKLEPVEDFLMFRKNNFQLGVDIPNKPFDYINNDINSQIYNKKQKDTVNDAINREIDKHFGNEIKNYQRQLNEAKQYDQQFNEMLINNAGQSDVNSFSQMQSHRAQDVQNAWENSETKQKIDALKIGLQEKYTPNKQLSMLIDEYGNSNNNPILSNLNSEVQKNKTEVEKVYAELDKLKPSSRQSELSATYAIQNHKYNQYNSQCVRPLEKQYDKSVRKLDAYKANLKSIVDRANEIGLPRKYDDLDRLTKFNLDKTGLRYVLYDENGNLTDSFKNVGYADDKQIQDDVKKTVSAVKNTPIKNDEFKSGIQVSNDYLDAALEEAKFNERVYSDLHRDWFAEEQDKDRLAESDRNSRRAVELLERAKRHQYLNNIVKKSDGLFTKQTATNIGYGVLEKAKDTNLYTFGITGLYDTFTEKNIADKIQRGQALTDSERLLSKSIAVESVMHQNFGDYEQTMGYKAGQVATESMKFMAEMAMTGGLNSILSSGGKKMMSEAARKYSYQMAQKYGTKYSADAFKHILGRNLAKVPGFIRMVGGDAAYSVLLANTVQGLDTYSNIKRLQQGNAVADIDQNGDLYVSGYQDQMSEAEAIYTAEARAFTENFSEMMGEYGIGAALKFPFKYGAKTAIGSSSRLASLYAKGSGVIHGVQNVLNEIPGYALTKSWLKPTGKFIKAGKYSGIVGETAEEYYGNAIQHMLGVSEGYKTDENGNYILDEDGNKVKTSLWEEINPTTELGQQTFLDIIGGIALSSGFLGTGSAINYARISNKRSNSRNRLSSLIGEKNVDNFDEAISKAHSKDISSVANTIINGISNPVHKQAAIDYYEKHMAWVGANQADQKLAEQHDNDVFAEAERESVINGYSVSHNMQRSDLKRGVDTIGSYVADQIGVDADKLDDVIEENGGAAEFIQYLKSTGNDNLADHVMAYNNSKMQYEASMQRLRDDIDEDLSNNERWVNSLSDNSGKITVAKTKTGNTVFIKSGVTVQDGELVFSGEDILTIQQDGSVLKLNKDLLSDELDQIDSNEVKHQLNLDTYTNAVKGFDLSSATTNIGVQIQMSKNRIGTIIQKTPDGRIMYSINDMTNGSEVIRMTEPGVTESQLVQEWADAYNAEFKDTEVAKAHEKLNRPEYDKSAEVAAAKEVREYIQSVKQQSLDDLKDKHGKAIQYASGVLTKNTVNSVVDKLQKANNIGDAVQAFSDAGVIVSAQNWERLSRLLNAFKAGNISRDELKEILCDGSTNMSKRKKDKLVNIHVDLYGNVTRWKNNNSEFFTSTIDMSKSAPIEEPAEDELAVVESVTKTPVVISEHKEADPESTEGHIETAASSAVSPNPQQNAFDKLKAEATNTSNNVRRDFTTAHNYFIEVYGKLTMFTRVHGILEDQYEDAAKEAKVSGNVHRLNEAYAKGGVQELKNEIKKLFDENGVSYDQYLQYLDQNDDIASVQDVILGVSNSVLSNTTSPSVVYGTFIDELCRKFFNGQPITFDMVIDDGSKLSDHMSSDTFKKLLKQLNALKAIYDALGWKLCTDPVVFTYQAFDKTLGRNVNVAGETDMIAVDKQGNYHIIDFKTSYKSFDTFIGNDGQLINLFESIPSAYNGKVPKWSQKEQYENQLTMYSLMVSAVLEGNVQSLEILPFTLKYDAKRDEVWFDDINNEARVLSNDQKSIYNIRVPQRIILNKTGRILNRFDNKKDAEDDNAKRVFESAKSNSRYLYVNDEQLSVLPQPTVDQINQKVDQLNEMVGQILDAENDELSNDEYYELSNRLNQLTQQIDEFETQIQQKISDQLEQNRLDEELKSRNLNAQNTQDSWIQRQATAQKKWESDWKATFENDYNRLLYLVRYVDKWAKDNGGEHNVVKEVIDEFNQLISNLQAMIEFDDEVLGTTTGRILGLNDNQIDEFNRCVDWVTQNVHEISNVEPQLPPTSIDEYVEQDRSWQNTNGLYKDQYDSSTGVSSAVSMDDDQIELRSVTKQPDFITNGEFRVLSSNGKIYIQITYGGHTYQPIMFFNSDTEQGRALYGRMNQALRHASSTQKVVLTGGIKRSFGEFIINESASYKSAVESGLVALHDGENGVNIYDIEYSATNGNIGITYNRDVQIGENRTSITEVRVPAEETAARQKYEAQQKNAGWVTDKTTGAKRRMRPDSPYALAYGQTLYTYSNANPNKPGSGIFVFMHNLGYNEDPTCSIPVTMRRAMISSNDAKFIVDAILGKYNGLIKRNVSQYDNTSNPLGLPGTTTTEFVKGYGGNVVIGGQTIDVEIGDIIDLLIPVKGHASYNAQLMRQDDNQRMPIYVDLDYVNETGEVKIVGNIEGDGVETRERIYNINTNDGIAQLEEFLQNVERNMHMNGFAQMRMGNIGKSSDAYGYQLPLKNNPSGGMTIKEYVSKNGSLKFGNSCIQFDQSDFSNPAVDGDTNGMTGMGWYLKNGFLSCMYNGEADPLIRIEDDATVSIVDESPIDTTSSQINAKAQKVVTNAVTTNATPSQSESIDLNTLLAQALENANTTTLLDDQIEGFFKEYQESPNVPIDEKKARANLERILGSDVPVKFVDTFIAVARSSAKYVGLCKIDGITLSKYAEDGVEYHEAFHRVMELIFTPEQRKKAYDKFRSSKQGREDLSDKQIAELFADEFMYYAMNQPTIKLHWNIIKTFREIKDWCNMWKNIGSYNLFRMYAKINSGKYANVKPDSRSVVDFIERANGKGFGYKVNNHEFEHILNSVHYKKLLNFIAMSFMHSSIQHVEIDGSNLNKFKIDKSLLIQKQVDINNPVVEDTSIQQPINFFTVAMANASESTRLALQEMLDNFDVVKQDIAAYVSLFASDYKIKYEQDNNENKQGSDSVGKQFDEITSTTSEEDIANASIEEHIKASYEFAPITRATEKTKFFFSGIPKRILTDSGYKLQVNELGLPEMYDAQYAFITVLNEVSNCRSIPELVERLFKLGQHDDLFDFVAQKYSMRWEDVKNGKATADEEAMVTQIFTQLRSTNSEFVLAKSINNGDGTYDVQIEKTDQSYNARQYVIDWAQSFAVGGCRFFRQNADGTYSMNGNIDATQFQNIANMFSYLVHTAKTETDWTVSKLVVVKQNLCACLNILGIPFTQSMLDKYLWNTYSSVDGVALKNFIEANQNDIQQFANKIACLNFKGKLNITEDGRVDIGNKPPLESYLKNDNFLTTLANAKYAWHRAHDQMSVLIANNAKAYSKSENNLITDRLDEIMYDDQAQRNLMSDPYNFNVQNQTGSLILKNRGSSLKFVTMGGFKTDEYGNVGIDYMQQSKREDYLGKAAALLDGYLLLPTLSDKKTWGFISGLENKMNEFSYGGPNFGNLFWDSIQFNSDGTISEFCIPDNVVNQMLEYAYCEHDSIQHVLDTFNTLPDNQKITNFHIGKAVWVKDGVVYSKSKNAPKDAVKVNPIQGARYTSLLGVFDETGKFVEFNTLVNESGGYKNEWENQKTANEYFFNKSVQEQQSMIKQVLTVQLRKELEELEKMGMIKRNAVGGEVKDSFFTYQNVGLPFSRIKILEKEIAEEWERRINPGKSKVQRGYRPLNVAQINAVHSLAVVSLAADIMNRHIISMQEFERNFSGNPAFFKFGYNSDGQLIDRTVDQSKRLGGLASTGTNNNLDIPGLPTEYRCVEINNPEPAAAHLEEVKKRVYDGEIRSGYMRYELERNGCSFDDESNKASEIISKIENMSIEEIEKEMHDNPLLTILQKTASAKQNAFNSIDVADGGSYITDDMCENLLRMVGSYDAKVQLAFRILRGEAINKRTGKPYTVNDTRTTEAYHLIYTTVIGTQKYTAYGFRYQNGTAIPYYNKMALFPLFKNMCTGQMAELYKAMKNQKIDMAMINSAVKVGSQANQDLDFDNLQLANRSYVQKYAYLRKQFNTDPKEKELMAMGTQMTKIVMSSMIPGRMYSVNGVERSATQIRNDIMEAINQLSDYGVKQITDRFFKDGQFDVETFSDVLKDELAGRGASKELIDGCTVVDGKMNLCLDAMSGMNWIQSILVSMINKKVIDINAPGHAFYQRSVWGMEGSVINDDGNMPPSINNGNKLEVLNEDGSMDCVLSIDFFHDILKGTDAEKYDFESQRRYLIRKGIIGPDAKANIIGYRIPTQAISSIHALRCVDVVPTVRDTVILPAEFTKITGSDFDIDKIFLSMKYYQRVVDEEKSTNGKIHHKTTDQFDKDANPMEYYGNMLIDNYLSLLKDPRSFNQLNGSIDNDTELLTSIVNELEEGVGSVALMPYQSSTLSFQANTKDKFVTGKTGIGPFALNNNNHILTMLYGVKFKEDYNWLLTNLGLTNLSSATDRDGKSIMSWLSGLINAHVDVAKDPYISKLNVNAYTYNLTNLLVRTGLGKTTFYFMTQPIMKKLAQVYNTASGVYMIEEGLSKSEAQRKMENKAVCEYVYANTGIRFDKKDDAIEYFEEQFGDVKDSIIQLFSKDNDVFKSISKNGTIDDLENRKDEQFKVGDRMLSLYEIQMLTIIAKDQFTNPAAKLADVVKYSKIDTKKQGKNITELNAYEQGVYETFESQDASETFENIDNLYRHGYIQKKTENAIDTFKSVLGAQTISATRQFDYIIRGFLNVMRHGAAKDNKILNKISKAVESQIKSRFFFDVENGYCKVNNINVRGLIEGNDCIYNRLLRLKAQIMSQPEYQDQRDSGGNPINYLLQVLTSGYTTNAKNGRFENAKFVQIASITQSDEIDPQEITTAWENMLNDEKHLEMKQFATDLIVYAFLTSADRGGNKDLFKYVPNSWKYDSGYADYMQQTLEEFIRGNYDFRNEDIQDIMLNNANDDDFVRVIKAANTTILYSKEGKPQMLAGVRFTRDKHGVAAKFTYNSIQEAPQYVKVRYTDDVTGENVDFIYTMTDVGSINGVEYPIYTIVNPRTTRFKQGNVVYGYGTRTTVKSNAKNEGFLTKVLEQKIKFNTTVDAAGNITQVAQNAEDLAVFESIVARQKQLKEQIAGSIEGNQEVDNSNNFDDSDQSDEQMKKCKE